MVNRSAFVLRPKKPFLDWVAQLNHLGFPVNVDRDQTVYLLPQFDSDQEGERLLKKVFSDMFERELFEWHTEKKAWPKKRNLEVFREWFDVEMHSCVQDLCRGPIVDGGD